MSALTDQTVKAEVKEESREEEQLLVRSATKELAKKAMAETVALAGKLGAGVKGLWAKIHVDRSPEAMLGSLNGSLDENRARREKVAAEMGVVNGQIVEKKKAYEGASPVRQRMLKTELQTLMAHYKSLEREFLLLSENEQTILTVKGRFMELIAHGLRGKVSEDLIDRLAEDIEEKAGDAESVQDAMGDLEKAGRRRDREAGDFDAELAAFGEPEVAACAPEEAKREQEESGRDLGIKSRKAAEKLEEPE